MLIGRVEPQKGLFWLQLLWKSALWAEVKCMVTNCGHHICIFYSGLPHPWPHRTPNIALSSGKREELCMIRKKAAIAAIFYSAKISHIEYMVFIHEKGDLQSLKLIYY